jgi:hypothetical protein
MVREHAAGLMYAAISPNSSNMQMYLDVTLRSGRLQAKAKTPYTVFCSAFSPQVSIDTYIYTHHCYITIRGGHYHAEVHIISRLMNYTQDSA